MTVRLEDMRGELFTEGDYVLYADTYKSLHVAKIRGIKQAGRTTRVALEIVPTKHDEKKRYSRDYHAEDFYKLNPTDLTSVSE